MDEVERLYTLPPEEFVAARNALATADPERAEEIRKLRKPTVAAWLVNLLVLRRPDLLGEFADLAAALRSAQRELQGAALRELSAQRRSAVAGLVAEARALAVAAKPALARANLPMAEVETTLQAALAEPEAAQIVQSGRLTKSIEYAGFGEVPRPQLRLVTNDPVATATAPGSTPDEAQLREAVAAARTQEKTARADLEKAAEAERDGQRAVEELATQLAELQRQHAAAEEELSRRKLARKAAEREVTVARRRVGDAEAALEAAPPPSEPGRPASSRQPGRRGTISA